MLQALVILLVGAGFGVVVVVLNNAEPTPLRLLSLISGGGAGWVALGVLMAAWWRRRLVLSVAAATLGLVAAVSAYYLADAVAAGNLLPHQDLPELRFWAVAALVVGPFLGLLGWRARRDGTWLGLAAVVAAPLAFAGESAIYLTGWEWLSPLERVARPVIIGAALALTAMMVARTLTRPASRPEGSNP